MSRAEFFSSGELVHTPKHLIRRRFLLYFASVQLHEAKTFEPKVICLLSVWQCQSSYYHLFFFPPGFHLRIDEVKRLANNINGIHRRRWLLWISMLCNYIIIFIIILRTHTLTHTVKSTWNFKQILAKFTPNSKFIWKHLPLKLFKENSSTKQQRTHTHTHTIETSEGGKKQTNLKLYEIKQFHSKFIWIDFIIVRCVAPIIISEQWLCVCVCVMSWPLCFAILNASLLKCSNRCHFHFVPSFEMLLHSNETPWCTPHLHIHPRAACAEADADINSLFKRAFLLLAIFFLPRLRSRRFYSSKRIYSIRMFVYEKHLSIVLRKTMFVCAIEKCCTVAGSRVGLRSQIVNAS